MALRLPRFALGRRSNPEDPSACALGRWAWAGQDDWSTAAAECGSDDASPKAAASRLAKRRWTLPEGVRRLQAKVLRDSG